jgi:hypothetical protein
MKKNVLALSAVVIAIAMSAFSLRPSTLVQYTRIQGDNRTHNPADFRYQPTGGSCNALITNVTCLATFELPAGQTPTVNAAPPSGSTWESDDTNGKFE